MSEEEQGVEEVKPVEHSVFLTADCGCRFQIVSAMPVLNAGVLHMPDIKENVCDEHRARQAKAEAEEKRREATPTIIGPNGRTIIRTK